MKLLVLTQKVDRRDPVLGFFHRWLEEFAKYTDVMTVICLEKGVYDLPPHVKVLSLGKEEGPSRLKYVQRFYRYIWQERHNYDAIFVHMNQEYVLLAGVFWRLLNKRIILWRNRPEGNKLTNVAIWLCHVLLYTSPSSYGSYWKKAVMMPVGIDTNLFTLNDSIKRQPRSLLYLGRISTIKYVDKIIAALNILHQEGVDFSATIVGDPLGSQAYYDLIREQAKALEADHKIGFSSGVPNDQTPQIYQKHQVFINLTPSGSLDKTIFEAMACGATPLVLNTYFKGMISDDLIVDDLGAEALAKKLKKVLSKDGQDQGAFRGLVVEKHGLALLARRLMELSK